MEQHRCLVCGSDYDTGALLLDQRLRPVFDRNTVTGNGLCPEHQKLFDEGYVALVGIDPNKTKAVGRDTIKPDEAYRNGELVHLRREAFARIFNTPLDPQCPMVFVDPEVIAHLKQIPVQPAP